MDSGRSLATKIGQVVKRGKRGSGRSSVAGKQAARERRAQRSLRRLESGLNRGKKNGETRFQTKELRLEAKNSRGLTSKREGDHASTITLLRLQGTPTKQRRKRRVRKTLERGPEIRGTGL